MNDPNATNLESVELNEVDFANTSFPLGIRLPRGNEPWLALDRTDLKMLHWFLTKRQPVRLPDGTLDWSQRACELSEPLNALAAWCQAGMQYYDRKDG